MRRFIIIAFGLGLLSSSFAVFTKLGQAGAVFLKIGVGRPTGMGDAFVAIADDASATYWNPAGLAMLEGKELLLNHIDWIGDINHNFISYTGPLGAGAVFGLSITALTMGDMEVTTIDKYQGTGQTFTASDLAFGLSYGRRFTDRFSFGLTVKAIQERIWDMSANGVGFDFGTFYDTGYRNLRLAMVISNFGPDMRYVGKQLEGAGWPGGWDTTRYAPIPYSLKTEPFPLPVTFRFGLAYDLFSTPRNRLTLATDLVHHNDVNEKLNFGLEYGLGGLFFLRGGYILNTDFEYAQELGWETGLSAGTGLVLRPGPAFGLKVDYCYRHLGRLARSHRFALAIVF